MMFNGAYIHCSGRDVILFFLPSSRKVCVPEVSYFRQILCTLSKNSRFSKFVWLNSNILINAEILNPVSKTSITQSDISVKKNEITI